MRRYFEFAVAVVLISVLGLVLLRALDGIRGQLEEAAFQGDVAAIRMGLIEVVAHREAFGGVLPKSENPIDWVANRPASYVGELNRAPEEKTVWYFDRQDRTLVYVFRDGHRARFRLSRDVNVDSQRAVVAGVGLLRLEDQQK